MTDQATSSTTEPAPASPETRTTETRPTTRERIMRIGLAALVALAIIGAAWFVGDRQGWSEIGGGGVNAQLLPKTGEQAPELFTLSTEGEPVLLSQLQGQPVWINFWGSWCPPCRAEMPEIEEAYKTLSAQGVVVLSISMREDPLEAVRYRDSVGATFPVYTMDPGWVGSILGTSDPNDIARLQQLMTRDWQIANFPTHVFIDRDGTVSRIILAQMTYEEAVGYGEEIIASEQPAVNVLNQHAVIREIA